MPTHHHTDDEIDLRELILTLWQHKARILVCTVLVTLLAAAYAWFSTPTYQTSSHLLPPTPANLSPYNVVAQSDEELPALNTEQAYQIFLRHVNSNSLKLTFFKTYYLPVHASSAEPSAQEREHLLKRFNDDLSIQLPSNNAPDLATVSMEGASPTQISDWVNEYVNMALAAAATQTIDTLQSSIEARKQRLTTDIATLRAAAEQDRLHRISRLKEDIQLAQAIDLQSPPNNANLIISYTKDTAYLRGSLALEAELALLEARNNNDPFIDALPKLLEQLAVLNTLQVPGDHLLLASVDSVAVAPDSPIKPKKALIVLLGVILGGMLGVFWVLLRVWWRSSLPSSPHNET